MITRTHAEWLKMQKKEAVKPSCCPYCKGTKVFDTWLVHIYSRPIKKVFGLFPVEYETIESTIYECEDCHTQFTVD